MDTNKVTLLGYYGGDSTHALSAWQSTGLEVGVDLNAFDVEMRVPVLYESTASTKKRSTEDLLSFLATHNHATPFEKSILHFQITAEIASHVHILKHRMSSVNSESARYKEFLEDKFYVPQDWPEKNKEELYQHCISCFEKYHRTIEELEAEGIDRKRAKESARFYLPYATQLNFDWMMNFRSFVNIQQLRNSPHAQVEIREIAESMLQQIKELPGNPFQYSLKAFNL